jgi:hypothetical protein
MREVLIGVFLGVALTGAIDLFAMQFRVHHATLARDCSLTSTYIIDNDTVLVCRVVKRTEPEANEPKVSERRKGEHDL